MAVKYIEEYRINGRTYGIDSTHGMWAGGCSIGTRNNIQEARASLYHYAVNEASREHTRLQREIDKVVKSIQLLQIDDPFNLRHFIIDDPTDD